MAVARRRWGCALAVMLAVSGCSWGGDDERSRPTATTRPPTTASSGTAATTTSTATSAPAAPMTTGPTAPPADPIGLRVWEHDFPDPFVLVVDGEYYAYATQAGSLHIQRLRGESPSDWHDLGEALVELPGWAAPLSTWAPSVLPVPGGYVLYYAALVAGTETHCIGAASATAPGGPFADRSSEPFHCPIDAGGAIDPSPFVDRDGRAFLLWKNDGVTLRQDSAIWSLPLTADGAAAGTSTQLIATDQAWELPHVEAPSMVERAGTYWLAYSGNWWNQAAYGVGLARCESPAGPCTKPMDGPVLRSAPGMLGPGGLELFHDRDGTLLAAFHAWREDPGYPGDRALWIAPADPLLAAAGG